MALVCRCILFLLAASAVGVHAAALPENRAFDAAYKELADGFYQHADSSFAEFVQKFPNSPLLPDAIFYQAQARVKLTNYAGAISLITSHQAQAGKRADEYLLCQADALDRKGDLQAAAQAFAKLASDFPESPRRLEAAVREASARARLADWSRARELLELTNGVFQSAARANVTNDFIIHGYLLLSEARFRKGALPEAEAALEPLAKLPLTPDLNWRRQYLLCRILLDTGRIDPALIATTNLLTLAAATAQATSQAESAALHAEILERLRRPNEAIAAYERNLSPGFPPDRQRQALLKITELSLAQNKLGDAAQTLEKFLLQSPTPDSADLALLTLGELRLRQHELANTNAPVVSTNAAAAATNHLNQAVAAFQAFTNRFPQSALFGKAQLNLGWCFWLEGKLPESQAALEIAVQRLPPSLDQATAYFKLGDTLFRQNQFRAALTNYSAVLRQFDTIPQVTNTLFEPALYQLVRAGIAASDLGTATNALAKLLAWFPSGFHTDSAVLLTAQEVGQRDPAAARALLMQFEKIVPGSGLLPWLQLAIARTHEQEEHWADAISLYDSWLGTFTNHEAQARAEYSRARANFEAGRETNAFTQFTNFIARFPTSEFAPLAQWWLADFHFRAGDFPAAEENYQAVFQNTNWPVSGLSYQARLMAGRAAFARQGWKDAKDYFGKLASNTNSPPELTGQAYAELRAQAYFALGDTLLSQDSTNKQTDYQEALTAFDQIFYLCPSNYLTALAWGAKANCLLQSAQTSQDYASVSNAFYNVITAPGADAKARSIATIGLGVTLEKLARQKSGEEQSALLNLALTRYLDVFHSRILRDDEQADRFWTRKAGMEAARLAESMNLRLQAANVYQRLQQMFPPLRFEGKINSLKNPPKPASEKS